MERVCTRSDGTKDAQARKRPSALCDLRPRDVLSRLAHVTA